MNERIRQLAEQAGCKVMDDGDWYIPSAAGLAKIVYTKGIGLEKFAELIVGECLAHGKLTQTQTVVNGSEEYNAGREMGIEVFMNQIKQHFGVEE